MVRLKEKNVNKYDQDVDYFGKYIYNKEDPFSSVVARKRQYDEIVQVLKVFHDKKISILDVGSGDGTFAFKLLDSVNPKYLFGFDYSKKGVKAARQKIKKNQNNRISFEQMDIYDIDKKIKKNKYDVAILSGVLHHLYYAKEAIHKLCRVVDNVIVIEPNGYNPILKIIENVSSYHISHEEKSYWPPTLDKWFTDEGYKVKKRAYFGLVPYFCSDKIAKILKKIEPVVENTPVISNIFCGSSVIYYSK